MDSNKRYFLEGYDMYCPRCYRKENKLIKMKSSKRKFHKNTKWFCSNCGLIRMEQKRPE